MWISFYIAVVQEVVIKFLLLVTTVIIPDVLVTYLITKLC